MHTFTLMLEFNYSVFDIFQTSKCAFSGRFVHEVFSISFMCPYKQSGRWQDVLDQALYILSQWDV